MIIKTNDFVLRKPKESDLKSWFKYYQDKDIKKNFMSIPKDLAEARKELFDKSKNVDNFVIDTDEKIVGSVSIHDIIENHKATISFWIAKKYRGKGIATKVCKIITKYVFEKYKLKRIQGNVRTFNKASAKVMEKCGYKLEGILRKNKLKDGKYLDDMVWAKVR
tara:strand:- start:34 stop:525 length:492 start_codon:yes stop_codon:yes gene_type:complete